jgi:Asp-tRNA(Asn)/Glu-tRNA(Gln) amidotransferase A subunit family amidase
MHLSGRAFSEQTLLRIAYATEQLIDARVAPVV